MAATSAFAQSSVTIGGLLDVGVVSIKNGVNNTQTTLGSGIHGASRVWFTGTEDLGGNMKANWRLEMQPDMTNGTTSSAGLFNRGAWAGLSGDFGELRMGRQGTNTVGVICTFDQHGCYSGFYGGGLLFTGQANVGTGNQGGYLFSPNPTRGGVGQFTGSYAAFATTSAATGAATAPLDPLKNAQASSTGALNQANPNTWQHDATRYVRAIRYSLPTLAAGLSVNAMYAFGQTLATGEVSNGSSSGVDAAYANGPLMLVAAYQKAGADVSGYATGDLTTVGGTYDFGVARVGLGYQQEGAKAGALNTGTAALLFTKGESAGVTVTVPMGAVAPYFKYAEHKYSGGTLGSVTNAKVSNVGVRYSLSKRTMIYADYVTNSANMGAGVNTAAKIAAMPTALTGANLGLAGAQKSQASLGIQHNF